MILLAALVGCTTLGRDPNTDSVAPNVAGPAYAYVNGQWLVGASFEQRTFYAVNGLLRDARPARIDSTIDLAGGFVIPPFADAHTHNLDGPFNLDSVRASYLREGTFYVQVLTNSRGGADRVRARFNQPCDLDVAYANGGISSTLSHPFLAYEPRAMGLYDPSAWRERASDIRKSRIAENNSYWFIDSIADLDAKWPKILAGHPDLLKIFLLDARETPLVSPDTGLPAGSGLRPSLVPVIVARAHRAGLRVAAHVETANDFAIAVRGGVDMLAHLPGYEMPKGDDATRYHIDDETARLAGARGIVVTPTLSLATLVNGPDDDALTAARRAIQLRNMRLLRKHGVHFAVGSDWFGRTAAGEFRTLAATGIWSPAELLQLWGEETTRAIFPRRRVGQLRDGSEASFLVLAADPLRHPDALPLIMLRVKQGCLIQ